jgi:hypothetical protein
MSASLERHLLARSRAGIAKWICAYVLVCLIAFLFARSFVIENLQILLPTFVAIALFLYFSLRLRFQIHGNIFGEIGFVYLAFAVAYTVFPAYGFLTLESLSSGNGLQILALLDPDPAQLSLELWRQVLFIAAVAAGYLLFRGKHTSEFSSFDTLGAFEWLIVNFLFVGIIASIILPWCLSAPVNEYLDNYTRYDNLPWAVRRIVTICTVFNTGGTFVLLTIMFRNYKRYRLYIWAFVLLWSVLQVLGSSGARIYAFMTLVATALLYHFCVKQITLTKGLLLTLTLGLVFSVIEIVRFTDINPMMEANTLEGRGLPAGELGAVFVPAFHLYSERASGRLPAVAWPVFFNDFISLIPLVDQTKWNPMYWYADNYFPNSVVPPMTMGPIAISAMWGGESFMFVEGLVNGILFAYLMRWFARNGENWQVMTIYVFCYSSCIMCLKYSIFWHLVPLEKIILPLVLVVSILAKDFRKTPGHARARSPSRERPSHPSSACALLPPEQA